MVEEPLKEPKAEDEESGEPTIINKRSSKRLREYEDQSTNNASAEVKKARGALLAFQKPSYCLKKGIGSIQCGGESLRNQHRKRLWRIFEKLIQWHNWEEASGVLSVLLQGTTRDYSISGNRSKYSAALELLSYIRGESVSSREIQSVYELWMKKLTPSKNWPTKDRFAVRLEFILTCLQHGSLDDAYQAALLLMQERGFSSDSLANLVVGLAFCQLWYSGIPRELQLTEHDSSSAHLTQSEIPHGGMHMQIDYSKENGALEAKKDNSALQCDSSTSIAMDKDMVRDDVNKQEKLIEANDNVKKETSHMSFQSQQFYAESVEAGDTHESLPQYGDVLPEVSIFYTKGLPPWSLPIKLPSTDENVEDAIYAHRKLHNNHYKNALKHLRVALHSTPRVIEALHPLIQMLLLGDQVLEALDELDYLFQGSDTLIQLRLKACILEHFDSENHAKLCMCFEDILKKDPTCADSLRRLILMHQCGDYDTQNLVEVIAMHLDASYGTCDTWKELASCFLKLSQCEGDNESACYGGNDKHNEEYLETCNRIPDIFTNGESGKGWRLRSRWWLNRHFNDRTLKSDIASGDLKLLTHKAAAASHIYGRHFGYVLKATEWLEKENEMQLYSFLQMHILNSIGFYSVNRNKM